MSSTASSQILAVSGSMIPLTTIFVALRLWSRALLQEVGSNGRKKRFGHDDLTCVIAWVSLRVRFDLAVHV